MFETQHMSPRPSPPDIMAPDIAAGSQMDCCQGQSALGVIASRVGFLLHTCVLENASIHILCNMLCTSEVIQYLLAVTSILLLYIE